MSDDYQRIELITGTARRRRWTTEQKLRIIEASFEPGETVYSVARRHGVAPNLLIAALSQRLSERLIEQVTPLSAISRRNCSLVYWADFKRSPQQGVCFAMGATGQAPLRRAACATATPRPVPTLLPRA